MGTYTVEDPQLAAIAATLTCKRTITHPWSMEVSAGAVITEDLIFGSSGTDAGGSGSGSGSGSGEVEENGDDEEDGDDGEDNSRGIPTVLGDLEASGIVPAALIANNRPRGAIAIKFVDVIDAGDSWDFEMGGGVQEGNRNFEGLAKQGDWNLTIGGGARIEASDSFETINAISAEYPNIAVHFPTLAPTVKPTNPSKPKFNPSDFNLEAMVTVETIFGATLPPTLAPTPSPTPTGYFAVKEYQKRKVVKAKVTFPVTLEQAKNPVLRQSIECGIGKSIGFGCSDVAVTGAGGVSFHRRRLASVDVDFQIMSRSDDPSAVKDLSSALVSAATEGSLVAYIQNGAEDNGMLLPALKAMKRELPKPTIMEAEVEVEVIVYSRANSAAPTSSPTATAARFNTALPLAPTFMGMAVILISTMCVSQVAQILA